MSAGTAAAGAPLNDMSGVEPLVYTLAAATAFGVAALAGVPSARRAAAVQPIVGMRAE
jgi:ABC-type lipoprotein release transport system permease subunit